MNKISKINMHKYKNQKYKICINISNKKKVKIPRLPLYKSGRDAQIGL